MKPSTSQNASVSHNNSAPGKTPPAYSVPAVAASQHNVPIVSYQDQDPGSEPSETSSIAAARKLIPTGIIDRKFRALSFASKLNMVQRSMLTGWLSSTDTIEEVRQKVAAPPPKGFGIDVCATTLRRLKALVENTRFSDWVSDSMNTACDLLDSEEAGEVEPLREALSLMLYSRALYAAKQQALPEDLDRLLSVITKIERLKKPSPRSRRSSRTAQAHPVTTRHLVELSVSPLPGKVVQVSATAQPANTSANDERVPENNPADR